MLPAGRSSEEKSAGIGHAKTAMKKECLSPVMRHERHCWCWRGSELIVRSVRLKVEASGSGFSAGNVRLSGQAATWVDVLSAKPRCCLRPVTVIHFERLVCGEELLRVMIYNQSSSRESNASLYVGEALQAGLQPVGTPRKGNLSRKMNKQYKIINGSSQAVNENLSLSAPQSSYR